MDRIVEFLSTMLSFVQNSDFVGELFNSISRISVPIEWMRVLKVGFILVIALLMAGSLFFVNDWIFERYSNRRIKRHKLTITNHGNTSSIFLLRAVELPKSLAIRFRVNGMPLIRVTYASKEETAEKPAPEKDVTVIDVAPSKDEDKEHIKSLIPDLNDPMELKKKKDALPKPEDAVGVVTKNINEVGKKAGFFASILSNIASLLPVRSSGLQEAQASLKGLQQDATQLTSAIGTKVNTFDSLGDQLGKLSGADKLTAAAKSVTPMVKSGIPSAMQAVGGMQAAGGMNIHESGSMLQEQDESLHIKNFIYDEEVWNRNIGKVDELGDSLNFFQSKILAPGESMKVDVELMNLSDSPAAVSHLYKIEVLQIPQSRLTLTVPNRYVNGVVIYEKMSRIERLMPQILILGLVIISIQIIAGISYLIF